MKTQRAIGMEFFGSLILALAIVGSGQMAANLTTDSGLRLFINALATGIGLAFVIRLGVKTSGSHFNPAVTLIMLYLKRIPANIHRGAYIAIKSSRLGNLKIIQTKPAVASTSETNKFEPLRTVADWARDD